MKKIVTLAALAVLTLSIAGCDSVSLVGPKMDTAKGLQQALDAIALDFNEYKPVSIRIMEGDNLGNEVRIVSVKMVSNNNSNYSQSFIVSGPGKGAGKLDGDKFNRETYDFETMEWIDPRTLSGEQMQAHIDAAKEQIPEGYTFESVGHYEFQIKKGKYTEEFRLLVTEDGNKYKSSAGQSIIEYYELTFKVLEDGSVYSKDLES